MADKFFRESVATPEFELEIRPALAQRLIDLEANDDELNRDEAESPDSDDEDPQ